MKSMFKKILQYSLLLASLFLAASCSKEEHEGVVDEIQQKPNWTRFPYLLEIAQAPDWKVDNTSSFTQSMTATIALDESIRDVQGNDLIAAFAGDECVGVTNYDVRSSRFYLYINEPQQSGEKQLTLIYYNTKTRTLRHWPRIIDYVTDRILGTVSKPFYLKEEEGTAGYPDFVTLLLTLPRDICTFEADDEISVFVGDECRASSIDKRFGSSIVSINVPIKNIQEIAHVRYYSSQNHRIYTSQTFPVTEGIVTCKLNP